RSAVDAGGSVFDEGAALELLERDAKLFLGVHHDRPLPCDRLADRASRYEQKPDRLRLGADGDDVARAEGHEVAIADLAIGSEDAPALEHVREDGVLAWGAVRERAAGRNGHVEVLRLGDDVADRALDVADAARDNPDDGSALVGDDRNVAARDAAIARLGHLELAGQI